MMKPGSYLINASRDKMIDQQSPVDALKDRIIARNALDVYEYEP